MFTQMLKEAAQSQSAKDLLPNQIVVELHYSTRMYELPWMLRNLQAAEIAIFSGMVYNLGGYITAHVKYVYGCDACVEVLYVRTFCD